MNRDRITTFQSCVSVRKTCAGGHGVFNAPLNHDTKTTSGPMLGPQGETTLVGRNRGRPTAGKHDTIRTFSRKARTPRKTRFLLVCRGLSKLWGRISGQADWNRDISRNRCSARSSVNVTHLQTIVRSLRTIVPSHGRIGKILPNHRLGAGASSLSAHGPRIDRAVSTPEFTPQAYVKNC